MQQLNEDKGTVSPLARRLLTLNLLHPNPRIAAACFLTVPVLLLLLLQCPSRI